MAEVNQERSENVKVLSPEEIEKLAEQNKRLISEKNAIKLEVDAKRHWDLFYKRNETRFFKDRHWTTREFSELLSSTSEESNNDIKYMLEVGCGVGNLIFPLLEENANRYFIYACDLSPRAVDFVKQHNLYDESYMKAFQCDITSKDIFEHIADNSLDLITMIFVLSAIHPEKFNQVVDNLYKLLKPGGMVLFRDYGLYDMAQLRFKAGHKIADNFYMRQDGTRSYFFAEDEVRTLFQNNNYQIITNNYVNRRTINPKEKIDVPRIFLQGKFVK